MKHRYMLYAALVVVAVLAATVTPEVMAAYVDPGVVGDSIAVLLSSNLALSKTLRQERANLAELNRQCLDKMAGEKDQARVKELEKEWDARDNDIEVLGKKIERADKQEAIDVEMQQPANQRQSGRHNPGGSQRLTAEQKKERAEAYRAAYWANLAGYEITPEERQLLEARKVSLNGPVMDLDGSGRERRAMSSTVAAGGYAIPEGFSGELEKNMLAFGGVRPLARILRTQRGNLLPWPTADDTTQEASIVSEGSSVTSPQDPTFGVVNFTSFMYRTQVHASFQLLQDEDVNLEQFIMDAIAERFARGTNRHYTVGNGATQPHGFLLAGSSGVTAASATSVGYADLVDLEHSVDPAYRAQPGCAFQMADGTLKVIKKLVDSDLRPLWVSGVAVREPNTILGYPYQINQHMPAVQASNKSVAFGLWRKFVLRDVMDLLIIRANELHIQSGQIGWHAFFRTDSRLLDAGNDPVKYLTHPSPN